MITLTFIFSAVVVAILIWKIQKIIFLYCLCAMLIVFGSLSILLLNFVKDQYEIGWPGDVGIHFLALGFLALVGVLVRRVTMATKLGRRS